MRIREPPRAALMTVEAAYRQSPPSGALMLRTIRRPMKNRTRTVPVHDWGTGKPRGMFSFPAVFSAQRRPLRWRLRVLRVTGPGRTRPVMKS